MKAIALLGPGWEKLATLADDENERLIAIEAGLAANPDAETKGVLQINKVLALHKQGDHNGAVLSLGRLALDRP